LIAKELDVSIRELFPDSELPDYKAIICPACGAKLKLTKE
jgi:hypothetical protein